MLGVHGVSVVLGDTPALAGVDLEVGTGETVAVLGPSGCGKTTLLRVVAGLQRPDRGAVELAGRDLTDVPPHRRGIGLMFQDDALFPHRDVGGNVAFGPRIARAPRAAVERRVAELLELVGLPGFARRSVATLSGGERQRVALARALAPGPQVLLLDEPFSSLDAQLRGRLLADLRALFAGLGLTVVYVTHDVAEAFTLGHRVAVMRAGRVVQAATPDELWSRPADDWVARFLGLANVLREGAAARVVRPEAVRVRLDPAGEAEVTAAERRGPAVRLRVRLPGGEELEAASTDVHHARPGDRVDVWIDPAGVVEVPLWDGR